MHTYVHENVTKFLEGFRYDAHPMGMLLGAVGALSTFYPDAKDIADPENRYLQRVRLIAKLPTIAAYIFRHSRGLPYVLPRNDLGYIGNFVNMTFEIGGRHEPNPVLQRALEIAADPARRPRAELLDERRARRRLLARRPVLGRLGRDRRAVRAAPRRRQRGRAADARRDRRQEERPGVHRAGEGGPRPADGLRPPRLQELRPAREADQADRRRGVRARPALNPKLEIALELERIALEDDYFVSRKLYPNVDFYSGLIYQAMGYPTDYFTVLFALGRLPGWIAQWEEMLGDPEQKIARPRQVYVGPELRRFVPIDRR